MGIFVATREPLPIGERVTLRFSPARDDGNSFVLGGVVQWVNPVRLLSESRNPGMGIAFVDLADEDRERLVQAIHTIAYLRDVAN
jgi:type IV pilus assembly protein PilZ